jgi:hypothetical protein
VRVKVANSASSDYVDELGDLSDLFGIPSPTADARTHKNGTFSVRGVRPGADAECVHVGRTGDYLDTCARRPLPVTDDATTHAPDLALRPGGAIRGVVRNRAGHALKDVEVLVLSSVRDQAGYALVGRNDHGHYRAGKLPAGQYVVCFVAYRYDPQCYSQVPWNVKSPRLPKHAIRVAVRPGRTVTGIDAVLHRSE